MDSASNGPGYCKAGDDATKTSVGKCDEYCKDSTDCEWFEWWPPSTCKVRKNIGACTIEESYGNVISYRPSEFVDKECDCLPDYCPDGMTCVSSMSNRYMTFID